MVLRLLKDFHKYYKVLHYLMLLQDLNVRQFTELFELHSDAQQL